MKPLQSHAFDANQCRKDWQDYSSLLAGTPILHERSTVLPFFKARRDLSVALSHYFPRFSAPSRLAHEFQICGDFVADLVIGDTSTHRYALVEFENGAPDSVFRTRPSKGTPEWAPRFEGAYSQLVDWLWKLEDMRGTADFSNTFGAHRASFMGLIVIGKDMRLAPQEEDRLRWRIDRTLVDSNPIAVVSFDDLKQHIDDWLNRYYGV